MKKPHSQMEGWWLFLAIVIFVIGIIMVGVAFHQANQLRLPTGMNWTSSLITLLVVGIIFIIVGIVLFFYSIYKTPTEPELELYSSDFTSDSDQTDWENYRSIF